MKSRFLIVMGVSGCGKSSVGKALASKLGWDFYDADDFHPPANLAKMASGIPLDDSRSRLVACLLERIDLILPESESSWRTGLFRAQGTLSPTAHGRQRRCAGRLPQRQLRLDLVTHGKTDRPLYEAAHAEKSIRGARRTNESVDCGNLSASK